MFEDKYDTFRGDDNDNNFLKRTTETDANFVD